ncbi:MAG: hypothetical protein JNJ84_11935 [Rhodobacteraceae bacterium]|nr:hypothetical protein [Paracoccaceae bacterium]
MVSEPMSPWAASVGAINLEQGFPEGGAPPALINAAVEARRTAPHQYPPAQGLPALWQAVAEITVRFAKPVPLLAEAARRLTGWRAANPSDARSRTEDRPREGVATGVSP